MADVRVLVLALVLVGCERKASVKVLWSGASKTLPAPPKPPDEARVKLGTR